jgi:hypothetical protein
VNSNEYRLLDPALVPGTLWSPESETLFIPPSLADAYVTLIDRHSLRQLSESRNSGDPPTGGPSEEHTKQHFAQAFDGSVARAELALLDPKQAVTSSSNALVGSMAGNSLCLTDAPCGAGAAAFALLSTVAELRSQGVLPRLPLEVFLVGAELSEPARSYAALMLKELRDSLEAQAIFVREVFLPWDVTDSLSNADLIKHATIKSANVGQKLLVMANFNEFLQRSGKRQIAQPQIEELFRHASGDNSVAIWIEPQMNRAIGEGGLFQWLRKLIGTAWRRFARQNDDNVAGSLVSTCSARFCPPLQPSQKADVRLAIMRIDLVRSDA